MSRAERRVHTRSRTYLGAKVVFNRRLSVLDCLIRNLSDTGARLVFGHPAAIPDRFELQIDRGGETRLVDIVWRSRLEAGVRFASAPPVGFVPLQATRKIRRLEEQRAALQARVAELSQS